MRFESNVTFMCLQVGFTFLNHGGLVALVSRSQRGNHGLE